MPPSVPQLATQGLLVSHSHPMIRKGHPDRKLFDLPTFKTPISTPVAKTKAPPNATCVAADMIGVSMYRPTSIGVRSGGRVGRVIHATESRTRMDGRQSGSGPVRYQEISNERSACRA